MAMTELEPRSGVPIVSTMSWSRVCKVDAVRVFVVDSYPMFRRGLATTLAAERDLLWVGEAADGAEALRAAPALDPDVVLIDQDMPGMDGIAAVAAMRRAMPSARLVLLTTRIDPPDVRRAVAAGASCVLLKSASSQELVTAIHAVHRGLQVHSPALSGTSAPADGSRGLGADLTPRERSLLALMASGLANREISERLAIAMPTVKFHVTNILAKLHVDNRTAAVLVALRHKLVPTP
ncbi:response regulator transcription factor [Ideonella sp. A 288]|uniref:response regulator n=1 Tax=Ideonella sp. A 288 TaxID=1962181 RepID=UPI000B4AABC9|nr:response regulator transcription factor [Ideonella sp. A 288]